MSYDFDGCADKDPPRVDCGFLRPDNDPGTVEMLLVLGAIELTSSPDDTFTFEELLVAARGYCGTEFRFDDDVAHGLLDAANIIQAGVGRLIMGPVRVS